MNVGKQGIDLKSLAEQYSAADRSALCVTLVDSVVSLDGMAFAIKVEDGRPIMRRLMSPNIDHTQQFWYEVRENENVVDHKTVDDPFVCTTLWVKGFWNRIGLALRILSGRSQRWTVRVGGTREAFRVLFMGDYTPAPPGPSMAMQAENTTAVAPFPWQSETYRPKNMKS